MKINAVKFSNFNFKSNKTSNFQTRPMGLKADTFEFSKNNIKSEKEILELDKKAREIANTKQSGITLAIIQDAYGYLEDSKFMWLDAQNCGEINYEDNTISHKVYIDDRYCEWVFDLDGNLKSVSNYVRENNGTKEIEERYTFINGNELESYESKIQEDERRTKIGEVFEFCKSRLMEYSAGKTISEKGITHKKESYSYYAYKLSSYATDIVEGDHWYTFGEKLLYKNGELSKYYNDVSDSSRGYEYGQISYFKNRKLIKTKTQG